MNHSKENVILMEKITNFLKTRNKNYRLWSWAIDVPLETRIEQLFSLNDIAKTSYENNLKITKDGIVLDLGCGFCPYWPFLSKMGFNKFIGFDLYAKRGYGAQEYMETASKLVNNFCPNSSYIIIEDDVRNILNYKNTENLYPNAIYKGNIDFIKEKNFDLIFTKNTNYKKVGSTGIPPQIFDEVCSTFLKKDGIKIYAG